MYDDLAKWLRERSAWISFPHHVEDYPTKDAKLMMDAADAIEELRKRIAFLMNCIYEAEDALDRGTGNEWARASLEKAERGHDDV